MNHELIIQDEKAIAITDSETKEVENFSMLPEYMELENLHEYIENKITNLSSKNIGKIADKIIEVYKLIRPILLGLLTIASVCELWYYPKTWIHNGTIGFSKIPVSIVPIVIFATGICLEYAADYISKNYDIKEMLVKLFSNLNKSKKEKLEKKLSLVKNRLTFLELKREQERGAEKTGEEIANGETEKTDEEVARDHFTFQPIDLHMQKEHLKRLKEIYLENMYSVTKEESNGNDLSKGEQLVKKYLNNKNK